MEKKICVILLGLVLFLIGCSDFTEIDPKGKNILNRVEELDLLLNYNYSLYAPEASYFVNDCYVQLTNIPALLNETIKTNKYAYFTWDESVDRVALTESDRKYTSLYEMIGKVANPVLLNVDEASGDRGVADRLKAEALVLRAWCHYLLVNFYAKAYDPATAVHDEGIVYSKESDPIATPNKKLSVAAVYELILKDLDAAFELESLSALPEKMRIGLPFAYAVKAKVLMSMRDYDGAYAAAGESLKLKSTIDDYNQLLAPETMSGSGMIELTRPLLTLEEELFETPSRLIYEAWTPELWEASEENSVFKNYIMTDVRLRGYPVMGNTFYGLNIACSYSLNVYYSSMGLSTVDMYLVRAECEIRKGKIDEAMDMLNLIREKRILTGKYVAKEAVSEADAFVLLKNISRTENFATVKTYINLKRWNTEEAYKETLHRKVEYTKDGQDVVKEYSLSPDSPLWVFPFPQNATNFNPNLTQNYGL